VNALVRPHHTTYQTTEKGGTQNIFLYNITAACYYHHNHHHHQYTLDCGAIVGGFNNVEFLHDLTSRSGFATD
jgi:Fe2+ or Zn2+ uptake regulation protein